MSASYGTERGGEGGREVREVRGGGGKGAEGEGGEEEGEGIYLVKLGCKVWSLGSQ